MEINSNFVRKYNFHFNDNFYTILRQLNQTHNFAPFIFTAALSVQTISLPSMPRSSQCSFPYRFIFPNAKAF